MIDKHRIRLMTKLAIYDKKYGEKDGRMNEFFKWDYIYVKNFWIRVGVGIGMVILACLYGVHLLVVEEIDVLFYDYEGFIKQFLYISIVVLIFYSMVGSFLGYKEYTMMQQRRKKYFELMDKLDNLSELRYQKKQDSDILLRHRDKNAHPGGEANNHESNLTYKKRDY